MRHQEIRGLRARLDLSQERFAQVLGVSLQTVRRWEAGLSQPMPIIAARLQQMLREAQAGEPRIGGAHMGGSRKNTEPADTVDVDLGGLGDVFKGVGGLFDLVSKMAATGQEQHSRIGETDIPGGKGKAVYGFSVRLGIAGKPVIESFGNVRTTPEGPVVAEVREPLVDVFDEGGELRVVAEMPGVDEKAIQPDIKGDILVLDAGTKDRKYHKEVLLPCKVTPEGRTQSYRNGLFELRLRKA